jgi:hypothetical protein
LGGESLLNRPGVKVVHKSAQKTIRGLTNSIEIAALQDTGVDWCTVQQKTEGVPLAWAAPMREMLG